MLVARVGFDLYVIHVDLHASNDHPLEDLIHQPLVCCSCILYAKRHYLIEVVCTVDRKSRLLLIPGMHAYLVVARGSVQEAQYLVPDCPINQPVNVWQGLGVLWAGFVEVLIGHAHLQLAIGLGDHDHIGQPGCISGFSDEPVRSFSASALVASLFLLHGFSSFARPDVLLCRLRVCGL